MKKLIILTLCILSTVVCAAQNNPYKMFGYEVDSTKTFGVEAEPKTEVFYLYNSDTLSEVRFLAFVFSKRVVASFDAEGNLIDISRFKETDVALSPDPMWHKYPHLTPYHYCANNPVMRVDPDGMADDEWDINSKGEIVNHIKTDKHDAFYIVDDNGRRIDGKSISFEYGTIKNFKSQYSDKEKTKFDWYNVRGDENGTLLFECMSNNTEVEWSQFKVGKAGAKGLNFLTTSHSENMESAGVFLYNNLLRHKYFIREHIHNHPNGLPVPSGMPGTTQEGKGDISFVSVLNTNNRAHKYGAISYKIYSKGFGYNPYNENSQVGDFEYIYNRLGLRPKMK